MLTRIWKASDHKVKSRSLNFGSTHALLTTLLSLAVIALIGVGIRLLSMATIQQHVDSANDHRIQWLVLRIPPYAVNLLY